NMSPICNQFLSGSIGSHAQLGRRPIAECHLTHNRNIKLFRRRKPQIQFPEESKRLEHQKIPPTFHQSRPRPPEECAKLVIGLLVGPLSPTGHRTDRSGDKGVVPGNVPSQFGGTPRHFTYLVFQSKTLLFWIVSAK